MVGLCFIFWGTSLLFSVVSTPIYVPPNSIGGFPFLHIFTNICYFLSFDKSHSDGCEVISHCGFYCVCLMISDVEHLFIHLLAICVSSLNNVHSYLLPIFWLGSFFICFTAQKNEVLTVPSFFPAFWLFPFFSDILDVLYVLEILDVIVFPYYTNFSLFR